MTGWPADVHDAVRDAVGDVRRRERLSGLSGREVTRVDGDLGSVVVKARADPRELSFYRDVAPLRRDVPTPRLHWLAMIDGSGWLVLEYVPRPLPQVRWTDPELYDVLAALHVDDSAFNALREPFRPAWTGAMAEEASSRLGCDLTRYQAEAQPWLSGTTPISGDPNPRNWRERTDGSVVLLDWERAGLSTPAVDVAITLPGLPTADQASRAARAYVDARLRRRAPVDSAGWPRALLVLKLWTAIELLNEQRDHEDLRQLQGWLVDALPAWLDTWAMG